MTAVDGAEFIEFEVSDEDTRLAEMLDSTADGTMVYLTRHGRRVGALESADLRLLRLDQIARDTRRNEDNLARIARAVIDGADASTRALLKQAYEHAENLTDITESDASLADPTPVVSLAEAMAEDVDQDSDDDVDGP